MPTTISYSDVIWKPILEFPGYEISNYGEVRSYWYHSKSRTFILDNFHLLHPGHQTNKGKTYLAVSLSKNGRGRFRKIHQLVLEVFIGPRPKGMLALHKDDNTLNNYFRNLYWGTRKDNDRDRIVNGHYKFNKYVISLIRKRYATGRWTQCSIAKMFNTSQTHISSIIRKESYSVFV